jgi:hypothetical protein
MYMQFTQSSARIDTEAVAGFRPDSGLVSGLTPLVDTLRKVTVHSKPLAQRYTDAELVVEPT